MRRSRREFEKRIVFYDQPGNALLNQRGETAFDFRVGARANNERFPAHRRRRQFKVLCPQAAQDALGVGQKADKASGRKKLRQQFKSFSC